MPKLSEILAAQPNAKIIRVGSGEEPAEPKAIKLSELTKQGIKPELVSDAPAPAPEKGVSIHFDAPKQTPLTDLTGKGIDAGLRTADALLKPKAKPAPGPRDVMADKLSPGEEMNPYAQEALHGLADLGASAARVPALVYNLSKIPENTAKFVAGRKDLEVEAPEWLVNNPIAKNFDEAAKAYDFIGRNYHAKGLDLGELVKKKDYANASQYIALNVVANAPLTISLMASYMTGAGEAANVGTGVIAAAQKVGSLTGRQDLDPLTKTNAALWNGLTEFAGEHFLSLPMFNWTKNLFKSVGDRAAKNVIARTATGFLGAMGVEGAEEYATQLAQDVFDKYTKIEDGLTYKKMFARATEAAVIGGASGGLFHAPAAMLSTLGEHVRNHADVTLNPEERVERVMGRQDLVEIVAEIEIKSKGVKKPGGGYLIHPQTLTKEDVAAQATAQKLLNSGQYRQEGEANVAALKTGMKEEMYQRAQEKGVHLVMPTPEEFVAARDMTERPQYLTPYTAQDYAGMRLFMTPKGEAGFALTPDNEIVSLFNNSTAPRVRNLGKQVLVEAIKAGGERISAFDGYLTDLYRQFGFEPVEAMKFDPALADPRWDFQTDGQPDIITMVYNGGNRETIQERVGTFPSFVHPGYASAGGVQEGERGAAPGAERSRVDAGEQGAAGEGVDVGEEARAGADTAEEEREIAAPVSLAGLNNPTRETQQEIYGKYGVLTEEDTNKALKIYDLRALIDHPELVERALDEYGYKVQHFSFEEKPARGIEYRVPDLKNNGYAQGTLWIYDPRNEAASFKDAEYTRAWRIFHEIGHAVTEPLLLERFGPSKREGRLGVQSTVPRGRPGKQTEILVRPLTLREAQRAIEWEDAAFRAQRALLEQQGITITDEQYAREYNNNISDAVYRLLTGKFGDPGDYGFIPSSKIAPLQETLEFLQTMEHQIAAAQGRTPTTGVDLTTYAPITDDEILRAILAKTKIGRLKEAARPAPPTKPEIKPVPEHLQPKFQTFENAAGAVTTKVLNRLPNKPSIKAETILQELNRPDVRDAEKRIIKDVLKGFDTTQPIDGKAFREAVATELLPLQLIVTDHYADYDQSEYQEDSDSRKSVILAAPFKTGVTKHGWNTYTQNYFSHFRYAAQMNEDDDTLVYTVKEVQSDLFQDAANLSAQQPPTVDVMAKTISGLAFTLMSADQDFEDNESMDKIAARIAENNPIISRATPESVVGLAEAAKDYIEGKGYSYSGSSSIPGKIKALVRAITDEVLSRPPQASGRNHIDDYKNTWHERTIKEAMRHAAKLAVENNLSRVDFRLPTGETALRVEGLAGEENPYTISDPRHGVGFMRPLTRDDLELGTEIRYADTDYIIVQFDDYGDFVMAPKEKVHSQTYEDMTYGYQEGEREYYNEEWTSFLKNNKIENLDGDALIDQAREGSLQKLEGADDWIIERIIDQLSEGNGVDDAIEALLIDRMQDYNPVDDLKDQYGKENVFVDESRRRSHNPMIYSVDGGTESGHVPDGSAFIAGNELMGNPKQVLNDAAFGIYNLYKKTIDKFVKRYRPASQIIEDTNGYAWLQVPVDPAKDSTSPVEAFEREHEGEAITADAAIDVLREYFTENELPVDVVRRLITPQGWEAYGKYDPIARSVTFIENPASTTPDHEALHAFMDLFADTALKQEALEEVIEKYGVKNANEAEEKLADLFPEYIKRRKEMSKSIGGKIRLFFEDLIHAAQKFFGKEDVLRELFEAIRTKRRPRDISDIGYMPSRLDPSYQEREVTRADIKRFLGKDVDPKKISKDELSLLRYKLGAEARGAKAGFKEGQAAQRDADAEKSIKADVRAAKRQEAEETRRAYEDANRVVAEEKKSRAENMRNLRYTLSAEQRGSRYGYRQGSLDTRERLLNQFRSAQTELESIRAEVMDYTKENVPVQYRGKFINMILGATTQAGMLHAFARVDREVEAINRKIVLKKIKGLVNEIADKSSVSVDYRKRIKAFVDAIELNSPNEEKLAKLKATQDWIDEQRANGVNVAMPERVLKSLATLQRLPHQDLRLSNLELIYDYLEHLEKLGKTKLTAKNAIYNAEKARILDELRLGSKNVINKIDEIIPPIGEKNTIPEAFRNRFTRALNFAQLTDITLSPMDVVFDHLDGNQGYVGANFKNFKKRTDVNFSSYLQQKMDAVDEVFEKAEKLGLDDRSYERIGVFAADQQESGREKLLNSGLTDAEIDAVKLTAPEQELYTFMRSKLDQLRPRIEAMMRDVYNEDLGKVDNYFSFMTDFEAMSEAEVVQRIGSFSEEFGRPAKNPNLSYTKSRKGAGKQKIKLNAMEIYTKHVDNALYALEVGRDNRMLFEIANSPAYKEMVGDRGQAIVLDWVDLISKKGGAKFGERWGALDQLRKNLGAATLGFKLASALVQTTQLMDSASLIGGHAFAGARAVATSRKWRELVYNGMPEVRARVGDDPAFLEFSDNKTAAKVQEAGMWLLKKLDAVAAASTAAGAYMKYLDDHNLKLDFSKPNPEAIDYAQLVLRRTQASSSFKDLPLTISKGRLGENYRNVSIAKAIFQFQNFMINRWSLIRHDLVRVGIQNGDYSKAVNMATWLILTTVAEQGVRRMSKELVSLITGGEPDDDDDFTKSAVLTILNQIPIVSSVVGMIAYGSMPVPALEVFSKLARGGYKITTADNERQAASGYANLAGALGAFAGIPGSSQGEQLARAYIYKDSLPIHGWKQEADKIKNEYDDALAGKRPLYRETVQRDQARRTINSEIAKYNRLKDSLSDEEKKARRARISELRSTLKNS